MPYLAALLSVGISIYSVWYLFPSSRPRPWKRRFACFAALVIIFLVPALRVTTGWSPAWPYIPALELLTAVIAYLGLIIASYLHRNEGKLDLAGRAVSLLLLIAAFVRPMNFVFVGMLIACVLQDTPSKPIRIDSTNSYTVFGLESLIGGGYYEGCALYQNPKSVPFVHRLIKRGVPRRTASGIEYCQ